MRTIYLLMVLALLPCASRRSLSADGAADPVAERRTQIEADWILQDVARHLEGSAESRWLGGGGTLQDAAGGCDGIKNGTYGFHTNLDERPWWQVDLGTPTPIERVMIYNRCDGNVEFRAARLEVLVSLDETTWTCVYRHDGSPFRGQPDGRPLEVPVGGAPARWVRVQLPEAGYLHLDEVEVFAAGRPDNVALGKTAGQSSISGWSRIGGAGPAPVLVEPQYHVAEILERGLRLAGDLAQRGVSTADDVNALTALAAEASTPNRQTRREAYLQARRAVRGMALRNPLLDFDDLLFVKRVPGTFSHMSDENYGWFSRPGGGLYVLHGFKTDLPRLRCLTAELPEGSVHRPDLSYDGQRILFAHCRYYPGLAEHPNKLDKNNVPEDAFYQLYEINLDGTGLRRLTHGKYDSFDGHYLPDGRIVFLSTRRGQYVQCSPQTAAASAGGQNPDCYVRCGGGPERPVAVYTLHVMDPDGANLNPISAFEMFEWTPSIDEQGRILYARWDYVDRYNMPYMSLWSTLPDGSNPQAVFGNYTVNPHCIFEARSIPRSQKLVFTAAAHHAMASGSLVLLDPSRGADGAGPMTRLTPEVCFPESEGWPHTYFASPVPLSEEHYVVAWSGSPLPPGTPRPQWGMPGPPNDLGIYLFDAFGNLELLYRDPQISSMYPLPVRPRPVPPVVARRFADRTSAEARLLICDVNKSSEPLPAVPIRSLRIVGVPAKTHPTMNSPAMGLTRDDPGKFVIGTVPVEEDGSAFLRVPAGVTFFVQALDEAGMAVQTMRSATYLQGGQSFSCVGCHEPRNTAPPNSAPLAAQRPPSKIHPGPEGSWPLDYSTLVQPVLEQHCVRCHQPGAESPEVDLTAEKSYGTLVDYGTPSLRTHVQAAYQAGRSTPGAGAARTNALWALLDKGHYEVRLSQAERERLIVWMDTYGQLRGSFSPAQENELRQLRHSLAAMLDE